MEYHYWWVFATILKLIFGVMIEGIIITIFVKEYLYNRRQEIYKRVKPTDIKRRLAKANERYYKTYGRNI